MKRSPHAVQLWVSAAAIALACGGASSVRSAPAGAAQDATPRSAQDYPTKPIRLIVPFAPGAGTDITARTIALKLTEAWGQPVVVDNRPGAAGTIGVGLAAKSVPDGYTLTMVTATHSVNASIYRKLPYDLTRDLSAITQVTVQPSALLVHPSVPATSVKELIALARAKPGWLNYGSSGIGALGHLAGALLASRAGIIMTHVPYKGAALALNDVIAGQIQMILTTLLQSQGHIKAGRVRALAVTTVKRSAGAPGLPTMVEAGVPGYEVGGWYGVMAPAKTPQAIVVRLNREIVKIVQTQEVRERLLAEGSEPVGSTPEEFSAHIKKEVSKWAKVSQEAGIRAE